MVDGTPKVVVVLVVISGVSKGLISVVYLAREICSSGSIFRFYENSGFRREVQSPSSAELPQQIVGAPPPTYRSMC